MERPNSANSVEPEGATITPAAPRKQARANKLTEWQSFFLDRLDHLLALQRQASAGGEAPNQLLSKAVYSTYLDCQTQGVGEEAQQRIAATGSSAPSAN